LITNVRKGWDRAVKRFPVTVGRHIDFKSVLGPDPINASLWKIMRNCKLQNYKSKTYYMKTHTVSS